MAQHHIEKVTQLAIASREFPQTIIDTYHVFHAGMYARTIMIPAGVTITGVLIKIPTLVILAGHALVYQGDETIEMTGYHVLPASKNRKQAYHAINNTMLTMLFPTESQTIAGAEAEFTDEVDQLLSHTQNNHIIITGE